MKTTPKSAVKPSLVTKKKDDDDAIKFVRLVKRFPCLYNYNLPEYTQRTKIDAAWQKIGHEMKLDAKTLRDRWRNYRTVFLRRCKAEKEGGASAPKTPYYLKDEMNFLLDFVKVVVPLKEDSTENHSYTIIMKNDDVVEKDIVEDDDDVDEDMEHTTDNQEEFEYDETTAAFNTLPIPSSSNIKKPLPKQLFNSSSMVSDSQFIDLSASVSQTTPVDPNTNPRKLFIMSITPELDKMTNKQFRRFRKIVLDYMDQCEDDLLD